MCWMALLGTLTIPAAAPPPEPPDFKVAFWYRRNDPLNTFQFQIYDVRKGEYDAAAVASWLGRVARDFPGYRAYVHDVRASPGEEPRRKVASVIIAEHIITGGPNGGYGLRSGGGSSYRGLDFGLMSGAPSGPAGPGVSRPFRSLPGVGGSPPSLPSYPFPVPYPYPRPHP